MPPANNPSIYFLSDINEINKNNQSYFLIKIENAHEIKMAISCESIICKFNNTNSSKSEVSGIADLLIKLNFPDKITGLSDKNGYKYTATKLVDEDDIKKLNKIISNNG